MNRELKDYLKDYAVDFDSKTGEQIAAIPVADYIELVHKLHDAEKKLLVGKQLESTTSLLHPKKVTFEF